MALPIHIGASLPLWADQRDGKATRQKEGHAQRQGRKDFLPQTSLQPGRLTVFAHQQRPA